MKKPELLAPCGSMSALEAAIEGGADAVYFGSDRFNARMRADNFSGDDLAKSISLTKAYGIKSYITLNTRLFDIELSDALHLSASLYEAGADALIVADTGIARLIKKHIPELEIHASTQLSGHNAEDAKALMEAGFTRMVCHREITRDGLLSLCKNSPIEIEMFIHGAYCVSFSGQCLMSAVMGGRSGNRGECAQPCRQPYTTPCDKGKNYPISLKDMCLASHITDMIDFNVASLKIEGRQKPPEYVYKTVKIYRRLLDEGRNATAEEIDELERIFSRSGFSDGYFKSSHRDMKGVRTYDDFLKMDKSKFEGLKRKVPASVTLTAVSGETSSFELATPYGSYTAKGDTVPGADSVAPLTEEGARKNSSRLGSTPFELERFEFITDGNAALTLSGVNALRRQATEGLLDTKRPPVAVPSSVAKKDKITAQKKVIYTAEFLFRESITPLAKEFFDRIYLPFGAHSDEYDISLPPYCPDYMYDDLWEKVKKKNVLAHTTGQLKKAKSLCSEVGASMRMNIFNGSAAEFYKDLGADFITVTPEAKLPQIRDLSTGDIPKGAVVYGRLPLMLTVRCAISDGGCKIADRSKICESLITDRHGVRFPIYGMPDCTNVIYNSVPLYMADKKDELDRAGITVRHFIFTDEGPEECDRIIKAYMNGTSPKDPSSIKRIG